LRQWVRRDYRAMRAAADLARTLGLVRRHARAANELPRISTLDVKDQIQREHEHVLQSLGYGREQLFQG
jgi:hypothetical protein